jgi:hypothetical protein
MRTLRTIEEACTVQPLPPQMVLVEDHKEGNQDPRAVRKSLHQAVGNLQSLVKENLTTNLEARVVIEVARDHRHQPLPGERQRLDQPPAGEHHHPIVPREEIPQHQDPTVKPHVNIT